MSILAIEGGTFAGKTTLVNELARQGLHTIDEYVVYAGGGNNFPAFPPHSSSEAQKSIDYFAELEARRAKDIQRVRHTSRAPIIVMDRSFWSCIVFQQFVRDRMPGTPEAYQYAIEKFARALEDDTAIMPGILVHLTPRDHSVLQQRITARGRVPIEFLNEPETAAYMTSWYTSLVTDVYGPAGVTFTSDNGNLDATTTVVQQILTSQNPYQPTIPYQQLLASIHL